jgi:hypothetical protein
VTSNPGLHVRTKHIDVRLFFKTVLIADGSFVLVYCKSAGMWGNFITKALPKASFIAFRADFIMCLLEKNCPVISYITQMMGVTEFNEFLPCIAYSEAVSVTHLL